MILTRRSLLNTSSAAAVGAVAASAVRTRPEVADNALGRYALRPPVAFAAGKSAPMPPPSPEFHLLSRASFGPTAEELARVQRMGAEAWLDEQLNPATPEDPVVEEGLKAFKTLGWTWAEITANYSKVPIPNELVLATLYRMVNSRRQLNEVMVDHWSSHFNIYQLEEFLAIAKTMDDRTVVRPNALGLFRPMLLASAQSPAMMRYLNTFQNTKNGPNENYAREVMELHTLGVGGGYTEADVKQVARCFTGWNRKGNTWEFEFRPADHALGPKTVLGRKVEDAANGANEGLAVLNMLVDHPSCARHVARRIARRLVADAPPESLVTKMAAAWAKDGDIAAMLKVLFKSYEFKLAYTLQVPGGGKVGPAKLKRPIELWTSALRVLGADTSFLFNVPAGHYEGEAAGQEFKDRPERYLQLMDQVPFRWRAPNGYPDTGKAWTSTFVTVSRWNYMYDLVDAVFAGLELDLIGDMQEAGVASKAADIVEYWRARLLMRPILPEDRQLLVAYLSRGLADPLPADKVAERVPLLVALMLDSPYFQWR